jgi:DNA-binding transcriptional MerR regulator
MISSVAEMYGIHPQTLRLYEREGLLKPSRTEGNTRLYTDEDLQRLEFILSLARDLGVNIAGMAIILQMRAPTPPPIPRKARSSQSAGPWSLPPCNPAAKNSPVILSEAKDLCNPRAARAFEPCAPAHPQTVRSGRAFLQATSSPPTMARTWKSGPSRAASFASNE